MSDYIRRRLKELHVHENEFNYQISIIDKEIKVLLKKKAKFARQVSNNMKYRNRLINQL